MSYGTVLNSFHQPGVWCVPSWSYSYFCVCLYVWHGLLMGFRLKETSYIHVRIELPLACLWCTCCGWPSSVCLRMHTHTASVSERWQILIKQTWQVRQTIRTGKGFCYLPKKMSVHEPNNSYTYVLQCVNNSAHAEDRNFTMTTPRFTMLNIRVSIRDIIDLIICTTHADESVLTYT